jgi:hypothetical protein
MRVPILLLVLFSFFTLIRPAFSTDESQKALRDAMIYHAYFGNAEGMRRALSKGGDPNTKDEHNWPLLAVAADRSDDQAYPISYLLLKAGANPDIAKDLHYPLINAIKNNNAPLVALLVADDANLRIYGPDGISAYKLAKKYNNPKIVYYLEKQFFEEAQTQQFLKSRLHLKQLTTQYAFHHCAFQYWGFYLRSKQDKDMNVEAIKNRMRFYANGASELSKRAAHYFPTVHEQKFDAIAEKQRDRIGNELNAMISNRNRREQGVGSIPDLILRCNLISTPDYFHAIALP